MKLAIGIDTGVHTGFAVWDCDKRIFLRVDTLMLHRALHEVYRLMMLGYDITVYYEDARQRRWIPDSHDIRREMGRRMGAGSVKRDAVIWEDFCKDMGVDAKAVKPQAGATKLNADAFARMTGWDKRTNNHARDAAMLVFGRN